MKERTIRILLADEDPAESLFRFVDKMSLPCRITTADTLEEVRRRLEGGSFDAVISGYMLGSHTAMELIAVVPERIPVIVVTREKDVSSAVKVMKAGAADYLIRDGHNRFLELLPAALETAIKSKEWEKESHGYYRRLRNMVTERTRELELANEHLRQEIEKRRKAERRIKSSEKRLLTVFEKGGDGILIADRENRRFLMANAKICEMLGYSSREIKNLTIADIHPEKDLPWIAESFDRQVKGEIGLASDIPIRHKDGSVLFVDINATSIRFEGKQCLLGFVRDASERRNTQKSMADLAKFSEENPAPVMRVSNDGTVLYGNPASAALLAQWGVEVGSAVPGRIKDLVAEAGRGSGRELVEPVADTVYNLHFTGVPGANYINIYGQDVSEARLLQSQLEQSQKLEAIGQLAGGVAHDFNNMMTAVIGYSEFLLAKLEEGGPLRRCAQEIRKAGKRAAALTEQLLAFSRKRIIEPTTLNLNDCLVNIEKMLRRLIGEDIELQILHEPRLGRVSADPAQIDQIIMNLVINARDAMPKGGKLTLETANVELDEGYVRRHTGVKPGPYVMLAISDSGIGMDRETLSHIFEPFFTRKPTGKGTGLGLSTVYGIVKQSQGHIWVYSEPDRGTTFKIYLARVESPETPPAPEQMAREHLGGSETVLLVEDEKFVRDLVHKKLEELGYTVMVAGHGEDALVHGRKHGASIDLLLTDVVMPGISGKELSESLRIYNPRVKVIFMSGYTDDTIQHHGVLDEEIDFIQKPFNTSALARKIRDVLDRG